MIRRGLQFLFGLLVLLGAAPCYSQTFPAALTLQSFTNNAINGYYVQIGSSGSSGGGTFIRYSEDGNASYYATTWVSASEKRVTVHNSYPASPFNSYIAIASVASATNVAWPSSLTGFTSYISPIGAISGTAIIHTTPLTEYEIAFPDWAAAGVKIPLGFAFGLALWATAVAFGVPMKWVRELTSAAS